MKTLSVFIFFIATIYFQFFKNPTRVVPDKINFQLCTTVFESIRIPVINLYLETPRTTSIWTSENLFVDVYFIDKKLNLRIPGYDQIIDTDSCGKDGRLITGFEKFTYRNIMIFPSYFTKDSLDIRIKLNGFENHILLVKDNLECKILPISVFNIEFDPKRMSTILYPLDVYDLYLSGHVNPNYDYLNDLIEFVKNKKIILANSKYPQINIGSQKNIFVVLNESEFTKLISRKMGNLPDHEYVQVNVRRILDFCYK